jgi:hypothetical protein
VAEPAVVWTAPNGVPTKLEWRGRRFVVCARPTPWIDRVPWWRQVAGEPGAEAGGLLEQPMWQVQATDGEEVVRLDLAVGPPQDWWEVTCVYQ